MCTNSHRPFAWHCFVRWKLSEWWYSSWTRRRLCTGHFGPHAHCKDVTWKGPGRQGMAGHGRAWQGMAEHGRAWRAMGDFMTLREEFTWPMPHAE